MSNTQSQILEGVFNLVTAGFEATLNKAKCWEYQLASVLCFVSFCIANPQNAINAFLNNVIDVSMQFWPSTPPEYTISGLYLNISTQFPFFGWGLLHEILQGLVGIGAIYLSVRALKLLPFT